jgi:type IV secretory pathway VirB4 component
VLDQRTGRAEDPEAVAAAETADMLRDAIARGTSRLLSVQLLLAVTATSVADLDARCGELREGLAGVSAEARPLAFEQRPGWEANAPGGSPLATPWRLVDAATMAATIPHPAGPEGPGDGVLVGMDPETGVPLMQNRFGAHNPTRLVVGTSGAGKSYAAKLEVVRQLVRGVQVTVIDPEGEFGGLGDAAGLTLTVGEEPAGLDPVGLACDPRLAAAEGVSVLASWTAALCGQSLSSIDLALLDRALAVLRADHGPLPSPADLLSVLTELVAHPPFLGADLPARLAPAVGGVLADLFAPNPDLQAAPSLVVFDLRAVPGRMRAAVMSCVLAWSWCQATAAGMPGQRLVVVDEAHLLLDDQPAAELLSTFARRARKYQVALDVVTQRLSDFLGHPSGQAVLANAASKLLLGCEDHERTAVADGLGLTDAETAWLCPGAVGRGLLLTPTLRTPVQVVAADTEHVVASAGPRAG